MNEHATKLSPEQAMFAALIHRHGALSKYWDWQERICDLQGIKKAMRTMSTGERIMAKFFCRIMEK